MRRAIIYFSFFSLIITTSLLLSRDFRVQKIPNGSKFSCANCHINPAGGGPRNEFGQEVEKHVTPGGTQNFWNSELAMMDSDGDGFTNGQELQDPNGTWTGGAIGNFNLVTNPGDPNSKPNSTSVLSDDLPLSYKLLNNYPNPFNPSTSIAFEIPHQEFIRLDIYNINGELVKNLMEENLSAGRYEKIWNGKDNFGRDVSSGVYIYRIMAGQFDKSARMILMK